MPLTLHIIPYLQSWEKGSSTTMKKINKKGWNTRIFDVGKKGIPLPQNSVWSSPGVRSFAGSQNIDRWNWEKTMIKVNIYAFYWAISCSISAVRMRIVVINSTWCANCFPHECRSRNCHINYSEVVSTLWCFKFDISQFYFSILSRNWNNLCLWYWRHCGKFVWIYIVTSVFTGEIWRCAILAINLMRTIWQKTKTKQTSKQQQQQQQNKKKKNAY